MKCPYDKEFIEKIKVIEGKYCVESVNNSGYEKTHISFAGVFLCPRCETILGINSHVG